MRSGEGNPIQLTPLMSFVLTRDIVSSWTAAEVCAWLCVELGVDDDAAEQLAIRESDRVDGKVCLICCAFELSFNICFLCV